MTERKSREEKSKEELEFISREVGLKEQRKMRARQEKDRGVWFGLGMFGMVGWSVAIPMLIGIALGIWIDLRYPSRFSWTLMLLLIGVIVGCLNAWYWVSKESTRGTEKRDQRQDDRKE